MAIKTDDLIRLRHEGMSYALKIALEAKQHGQDGVEILTKEVERRGYLKCSVKFTPDELNKIEQNISDRIYNNMLCIWYSVFRDKLGFGKERILRLKRWYDEKVYSIAETDGLNTHWCRFVDYAEEANEYAQLGIEIDKVLETEYINRQNDVIQGVHVRADDVENWIRKNGTEELAVAFHRKVYGDE